MKKWLRLCALLLALVLVLCACTVVAEENENSTGAATDSVADSANGTKGDDSDLSTQGQDAPADLRVEEEFENLIGNGWYWRALGCTFEKPEDIPAKFYFYGGVGANEQATGEELAFILDAYKKKNPNSNEEFAHNYMKLPVAKMNEALTILGVTVENIKIPDHWAYYDKTDAYYFWVSDAYGVTGWSVTKVEKGEDGMVAVYWETKDAFTSTSDQPIPGRIKSGRVQMIMTLQLQPDGTYRVISNLPQE